MSEAEVGRLRQRVEADRRLIERAEQALAEIDRGPGLADHQAEVLAALRIRLEGKERASLDDLISAAGDMSGKKDLGDVLTTADHPNVDAWPVVEEKKREWPGV